jgi:hypothetical protein
MFICGICNTLSARNESAVRVVTETRTVTHPFRKDAHKYIRFSDGKEVIKDDPGGKGSQVVKEVLAHERCAQIHKLSKMPDDEIDFSDIPEITDWSGAVRGKYYRKPK